MGTRRMSKNIKEAIEREHPLIDKKYKKQTRDNEQKIKFPSHQRFCMNCGNLVSLSKNGNRRHCIDCRAKKATYGETKHCHACGDIIKQPKNMERPEWTKIIYCPACDKRIKAIEPK